MMPGMLGIDVGVRGALALLSDDGSLVEVIDMPSVQIAVGKSKRTRIVPAELLRLMRDLAPDEVLIEQVDGRAGMGGGSMCQLGKAAGFAEMAATALGIPVSFTAPNTWKRIMHVTSDKETSRRRAMQLWPEHSSLFAKKKDADRAEAALIARYGWLLRGWLPRLAAS